MENVVRNGFIRTINPEVHSGNAAEAAEENFAVSKVYEREAEEYSRLNEVAAKNGVVIFGSTFAKDIPASELRQSFNLSFDIYNRSFTDVSVFDAEPLLIKCAESIAPSKLILQLGETDLERGFKSVPEIISAYDKLVKRIKKRNRFTDVVIFPVCENENGVQPSVFNSELAKMAKKNKCRYADITGAAQDKMPAVKAFSLLKSFMRGNISFFDAMTMVNY